LDIVETTATPMLAPPPTNLNIQSYFDAKPVSEDSLQSGALLETKIQPYIAVIGEIFDRLTSLVSSLQDPVPWDDYQRDSSGEELQEEIERAKRMFERAPSVLIERLGYANWKRTHYLKKLREEAHTTSTKISQTPKRFTERGFQLPATIPLRGSKNPADGDIASLQPTKVDLSHRKVFSRKPSNTLSYRSTTNSNIRAPSKFDSALGTSIAGTEETQKLEESVLELERYLVPKPPILLEPNKVFSCPYCLHEVAIGSNETSEENWAEHVYMDLEPYMCTYEFCPREQRTYGSKEDWFRHELNTHRIPKVYLCQSCGLEYEKQELLEQHLGEAHGRKQLKPEELAVIASMCERSSQIHLKNQPCHLCGETDLNIEILRDHLADHLEQFALTSIKSEDELEEDLPLSPQFSDSGSERRFRLGLGGLEDLETMVEEKVKPILQQHPAARTDFNSK
jgi:hypothetical protein